MESTILHIEDDDALRAIVQLQFERFGFRGTLVPAGTVREGIEKLADGAFSFNLVICDMNLPDGTGLDVVRYVRSSPVWKDTPVLILSSDVNPKTAGAAYALGANAYVDKAPAGRTLSDVMRSLYDHWTKDVILPEACADKRHRYIAISITIRKRHAHLYERLAEVFSDKPTESAFWLSRALAESNLINLLAFVRQHLDHRPLSEEILDAVDRMQASTADALTAAEKAFAAPTLSRDVAYRHVVNLIAGLDITLFTTSMCELFPATSTAKDALVQFLIGNVEDVTAWVDLHTQDATLHARTAGMRRSLATTVTSQPRSPRPEADAS
jgi:two-component system chemotaxis response regulator CheY